MLNEISWPLNFGLIDHSTGMISLEISAWNYFRFWAGFLAINQYFPTCLICLQFLQCAAILARKNCTCNHSFIKSFHHHSHSSSSFIVRFAQLIMNLSKTKWKQSYDSPFKFATKFHSVFFCLMWWWPAGVRPQASSFGVRRPSQIEWLVYHENG